MSLLARRRTPGLVLLASADDGTWYHAPSQGDVGDDDGYLIAAINAMLDVLPLLFVTYLSALAVARIGRKREQPMP